jgi:UDP-N-acetylglucosamine transferase subunit ALG13
VTSLLSADTTDLVNDVASDRFTLMVTFGTDHHHFDRLSHWLEPWLAHHPQVRCLVQEGYTRPPAGTEAVGIVSREELLDLMRSATVVVGQGGPGTILDAAVCGRLPIVVPRLARHDEVVDDHQVAFCRRMSQDGRALLAESPRALYAHLDRALADPASVQTTPGVPPIDETVANVGRLLGEVAARRTGFVSLSRLADLLGHGRRAAAPR